MSMKFIVRKALPSDAEDFANLIISTDPFFFPALFGKNYKSMLKGMFTHHLNLFSYQHSYFAESKGKILGMILGYDNHSKKTENWRTGLLMLKYLGLDFFKGISVFIMFNNVMESVCPGEFYISNLAVYPEYRGMGIGTYLITEIENYAKAKGIINTVLEVDVTNIGAFRLYERLGYEKKKEFSIRLKSQIFRYFKMSKKL